MPFVRPTLDQLISRTEADVAGRLGLGTLVPRGFLKALARTHAGMLHGAYGFIDWASLQGLPDTADPERMEAFAKDWGVIRKPATFAEGPVDFTGSPDALVALGVQVQRADGQQYEVLADTTLTGGAGTATVRALLAGFDGNSDVPTPLSLVSPVVGVDTSSTVANDGITDGIIGGTDAETDAELLARLLQKMQNVPQGGALADYIAWTLEVPGVTRAWCLPGHFGAGTVGVTFAVDDDPAGPIPDVGKVAEVQAYLDDPTRQQASGTVTVFAPVAQVITVSISGLTPDNADTRAAIVSALEDLVRREGGPGGVLLGTHVHQAISNAPGVIDYTLNFPVANTAIAAGKIPVLGAVTWP